MVPPFEWPSPLPLAWPSKPKETRQTASPAWESGHSQPKADKGAYTVLQEFWQVGRLSRTEKGMAQNKKEKGSTCVHPLHSMGLACKRKRRARQGLVASRQTGARTQGKSGRNKLLTTKVTQPTSTGLYGTHEEPRPAWYRLASTYLHVSREPN